MYYNQSPLTCGIDTRVWVTTIMVESTRISRKLASAWAICAFFVLSIVILCSCPPVASAHASGNTPVENMPALSEKADGSNASILAMPENGQVEGGQTEGTIAGEGVSGTQSPTFPKQASSSDDAASPDFDKVASSEKVASSSVSAAVSSQTDTSTQQKPIGKPTKAGWMKDSDGTWYYFANPKAKPSTGWINSGGVWYWLQPEANGAMARSRWITDKGRDYYLRDTGHLATGWIKDAGQWYYAGPTGAKVGGGWISLGGTWYWLDSANKGAMVANVIKRIGGKDYSFTSSGSMRAHCQVNLGNNIAGYAADSGAISRIGKFENGKLVLTDDSGKIVSGWCKVAGLWFYGASKTGVAQIGWLNLGGVWYYLDSSGAMVTGNRTIDGKVNVFDGSGRWLGASVYTTRAQGYSSGTNRLILVDRGNHKVVVFNGRQGNWNLEHEWSCVTGAPGTPTITGTFRTTGYKMGTLTTDGRAHYCTQIAGGYFFHTILASDSELGQSLSHGCIRLSYPNAQWIYNNIGAGTTVAIFN